MAKDGTTADLFDLEGLSDAEILALPSSNLPSSLLADFLARRDVALHNQEAAQAEAAEQVIISRERSEDNADAADAQRYAWVFSEYETAMRDIEAREDELLRQLDEQAQWTKKRLADIEKRTLKLQDGTRAYVGTNGTYVDEKGNTLQGTRLQEARTQHQQHADAATWTEKAEAQNRWEEVQRVRQEILDAREQRKLDANKNLSAQDLESRIRDRTAAMSRYETEFQDQVNSRTAATAGQTMTDATYGGSDYMGSYGDRTTSYAGTADDTSSQKGLLARAFDPASVGQGPAKPEKPVPRRDNTPTFTT